MSWRYRRFFLGFEMIRRARRWMKGVTLRRHQDVSLYRVARVFISHLSSHNLLDRANAVALNFILAIFPAIIFLFTLIPYVNRLFPAISSETIVRFISETLPSTLSEAATSTIFDIVDNQRGGLLTFGFFFALFLSTNGMLSLMRAFNACYHTVEQRNAFQMRFVATGLTFMLAIVLMMAVVLLVGGQIAVNLLTENIAQFSSLNLNIDAYTIYLLLALRFVIIFVVLFVAISFVYYFGPSIHYNWHFFSVGSFVASLGTLLTSHGFSYYLSNFGAYNKIYGSIGVLIALIVLVQLITVVLLLGYEVNTSLHYSVKADALEQRNRTRYRKRIKAPAATKQSSV